MAAANASVAEARRMVLRIGVNLGDVMVEGSDLYGDCVNIAARLEGVAEPGGIALSGTAFDHVKNKIKAGIEDLGLQTLKNIVEPVRVYRITSTPPVAVSLSKEALMVLALLPAPNGKDPGSCAFQLFPGRPLSMMPISRSLQSSVPGGLFRPRLDLRKRSKFARLNGRQGFWASLRQSE
jgi:hypothetical protein